VQGGGVEDTSLGFPNSQIWLTRNQQLLTPAFQLVFATLQGEASPLSFSEKKILF